MRTTVLCHCIKAQCDGRNCQSSARLGSALAQRNRAHNRGSPVISTWYLDNFKSNAGTFVQKIHFYFSFYRLGRRCCIWCRSPENPGCVPYFSEPMQTPIWQMIGNFDQYIGPICKVRFYVLAYRPNVLVEIPNHLPDWDLHWLREIGYTTEVLW